MQIDHSPLPTFYFALTHEIEEQLQRAENLSAPLPLESSNTVFHKLKRNCAVPVCRKPIDSDDFAILLEQAGESANLADLLAQNGFSKVLSNLVLTKWHLFNRLRLKGLSFTGCNFDLSHFSGSTLTDCHFEKCTFENSALMNAKLQKCRFTKCNFYEAMFVNAELGLVQFEDCELGYCSFEDAAILDSTFVNVNMSGTHFLNSNVKHTSIKESNLTDVLFFGNNCFDIDQASRNTARVLRPTTVTLLMPEARGISGTLIVKRLHEIANTIPVRINAQSQRTTKEILGEEMAQCLAKVTSQKMPTPQKAIQSIRENPQIYPAASAILAKAATLAKYVDSIVLPGGEDMAPELYGEQAGPRTKWDKDYRRSVLELGLIHEAVNKGIPLIGVCRGFHMIGTYFGAKLYQHIGSEQIGVQILTKEAQSSMYGSMFDDIHTAVCHHQAIRLDSEMNQLQVSVSHVVSGETENKRKIAMAFESIHSGVPMAGVQFHTEFFEPNDLNASARHNADLKDIASSLVLNTPMDLANSGILRYMSDNNPKFWKLASDMATIYRSKTRIMPFILQLAKKNLLELPN